MCIARRASRYDLPSGYFESLATVAEDKAKEFTVEKSKALSEEQVMALYHDGLMFLRKLVEGVNEELLRPAP